MKSMIGLGLVLNDGSTYTEKGKVDAISGIIDSKTGAVSIRAVFPNPNRILRSGGAANVLMPYTKKLVLSSRKKPHLNFKTRYSYIRLWTVRRNLLLSRCFLLAMAKST